ncbi:hypothetical protein FWH58_02825 [Candidatus Saccharibacteria bacterium]|nr:hypothetical protein [Candidatus Saccharibacteria bacterium]
MVANLARQVNDFSGFFNDQNSSNFGSIFKFTTDFGERFAFWHFGTAQIDDDILT